MAELSSVLVEAVAAGGAVVFPTFDLVSVAAGDAKEDAVEDATEVAAGDAWLVGTGAAGEEEVIGTGAATEEEVIGTGAATEEEVIGTGAATEEEVVGTGAATEEEVVGTGAATEGEVIGTGAATELVLVGFGTGPDPSWDTSVPVLSFLCVAPGGRPWGVLGGTLGGSAVGPRGFWCLFFIGVALGGEDGEGFPGGEVKHVYSKRFVLRESLENTFFFIFLTHG
ncbi:MAG: hypothetical protein AAFW73_26715, partial [Bacteroidota bacterium]